MKIRFRICLATAILLAMSAAMFLLSRNTRKPDLSDAKHPAPAAPAATPPDTQRAELILAAGRNPGALLLSTNGAVIREREQFRRHGPDLYSFDDGVDGALFDPLKFAPEPSQPALPGQYDNPFSLRVADGNLDTLRFYGMLAEGPGPLFAPLTGPANRTSPLRSNAIPPNERVR